MSEPTNGMDAYLDAARLEIVAEFGRCSGEEVTEEIREALMDIFADTVQKGVQDYGVKWEEPIRSYVLRHVCKIAARAKNCAECGELTAEDVEEAAGSILDRARRACKLKEDVMDYKLGVLCPTK